MVRARVRVDLGLAAVCRCFWGPLWPSADVGQGEMAG